MQFGIIKVPQVFLETKQRDVVTDEIFMGWAVAILEETRQMYRIVTHYGYQGYLPKHAVEIVSMYVIKKRIEECNLRIVASLFADVMEEPKVSAKCLATLQKGSFVEILDSGAVNGYLYVCLASGVCGYVPAVSLIWRLDNDGYLYEMCGPPKENGSYFLRQKILPEQIFRERVTYYALSYLRTPYRWAGKSAEGIDCSGLTFMSYMMCGMLIYRDAAIMPVYPVREIAISNIKKGDLLYFTGHVALYLGDGKYVHATGNAKSHACVINSLKKEDWDYRDDLVGSLYAAGSIF